VPDYTQEAKRTREKERREQQARQQLARAPPPGVSPEPPSDYLGSYAVPMLDDANDPLAAAARGLAAPATRPIHVEQPKPAAVSAAALLEELGIPQYIEGLEREAIDIELLTQLARHDGKEALDETLKEIGIMPVGHRLRIYKALATP